MLSFEPYIPYSQENMVLTHVIVDFRTNLDGSPNACNCIIMPMLGEPRRSAKESRGLANGK